MNALLLIGLMSSPLASAGAGCTVDTFSNGITKHAGLGRIAPGPDGNLWFTELYGRRIGKITPAGVVTEYPLPGPHGVADGLTAGPNDTLWFADAGNNAIGKVTTAGAITEYPIPTERASPYGIARGSNGDMWFTEHAARKIGRVTQSGAMTEYALSFAASGPSEITAGPDGNLWFVYESSNRIGEITGAGELSDYPLPERADTVLTIVMGPEGSLWFTVFQNGIGRMSTSGSATVYPLGDAGASGLAEGPDGNLWFTDYKLGAVGAFTPAGKVAEYRLPASLGNPGSPAFGSDGNLWFTAGGNAIARISPRCVAVSAAVVPREESTPAPPFRVRIEGKGVPPSDLIDLEIGMIGASQRLTGVQTDAASMPQAAPDVWYAGNDTKQPGKGIVWFSRSADQNSAAFRKQQTVALVLRALDEGFGGKVLQSLFAATSQDTASRVRLGGDVFGAMQSASDQTVQFSTKMQTWLLAHIKIGMTRSAVYEMVKSQNVRIYDWDYGGRISRPVAIIALPGAFEPGCSFSTNVTLTFDSGDRVDKIELSKPIPDCL